MKRILLSLLCFTATSSLALAGNPDPDRPKLVVGLVVDQMRWDYLYKFYDRYGNDGFRRLMRDGFNCEQTFINYIPSYTAPGHTCVYTGSVPAIHGIAGNEWFDNHTGKYWYCTEDTAVLPVGGSRLAGRMSPRNLLTSTVTDELRLATNFGSRVFGIAMKDRGSILPAGHLGAAYWYDDSTGNFISSTYYSESLPGWLEQFNNRRLADSFLSKDWHPLYPAATYRQSLPDNNRYEGLFPGEVTPVFPHSINRKNGYGMLRRIPAGNTMTLDAARSCLRGEQLGKGKFTDFLCISLSSTDYIGHQYAPDAMEVEDTYLRLDRELASLLKFLDEHVGKGQYLF
ncbi:MAG: alkaline phosphatase family protein, partial [Sphingobacteriales bacterium]